MTSTGLRLIVNADDLGISSEVNERIFEMMAAGRVTSATMLANGAEVESAAANATNFPQCSFGVHLNLTQFRPLTDDSGLAPILSESGEFNGNQIRKIRLGGKLREAIFLEWQAQINRLRSLGVELTHIDSHHHVHTIPSLFSVLKRIQKASGIRKVRLSMNVYGDLSKAPRLLVIKKHLWNFAVREFYRTATTSGMTDLMSFLEAAGRIRPTGEIIEVMVHPGGDLYRDETKLLRGRWFERLPFRIQLTSYRELSCAM